jgi:phosphoglycerate dehydrogenase-like enzyme
VRIWSNADFGPEASQLLERGTKGHTLVLSRVRNSSVLAGGTRDPDIAGADIAFGQPDPGDCMETGSLRWIEVSSAGYTRYDTVPFREALRARGAVFTNASQVYADACAEHVLAMMLSLARELPASLATQLGDRAWNYQARRDRSRLLRGQTIVLLGFGAIGRRLAELLGPFHARVYAVRRQIRSEPGVHVVPESSLTKVLAEADHVVNLLPENDETLGFVNGRRIECIRKGARFYNIGRGPTVDQRALIEALKSGRIGAAYLDVMVPEPLPPEDPLWSAPNCYITPHTAGGRNDTNLEIIRHFLANLEAFQRGAPMTDRIV